MEQLHYDYEKLGLAPWRVDEKPPLAIRKLWLGRLIADFFRWQAQMEAQYADFYLAVWLYEPDFGNSQLVGAIEARKSRYENLFGNVVEKPLPIEYRHLPGIDNLQWTAKANVHLYSPEDFTELGSWASQKSHWAVETADGVAWVAVQVGWVWIGQAAPGARKYS